MPTAPKRAGLLRVLLRQPHRYRSLRGALALASLAIVAAPPLLGLGRLDLWRGDHRFLGEPVTFAKALFGGVLFGVASYLITFVVNAFGGRLFCGFGCPLAQANRLVEQVGAIPAGRPGRGAPIAGSWLFALLYAAAVLHWWIDPRLWLDGSASARAVAAGVLLLGTALIQAHAHRWHWAFCRGWCPVGLYYSVVMPSTAFGIRFSPATCIDCNACDHVCPVDLRPRELTAEVTRDEGFAIASTSGVHHCLSCGDCVEACELVLTKRGVAPIALTLAAHPFGRAAAARQLRRASDSASCRSSGR